MVWAWFEEKKGWGKEEEVLYYPFINMFYGLFFHLFFIFTWLGPSISRFSFSFIFYLLFLGIQDSRFKIQKKKEDGEGNEDGDAESGRER